MRLRPGHAALVSLAIALAIVNGVAVGCGSPHGDASAPASSSLPRAATENDSPDAIQLVPRPQNFSRCEGAFTVDASTRIVVGEEGIRPTGERLARWFGLPDAAVIVDPSPSTEPNRIVLLLLRDEGRDPSTGTPMIADEEAYELAVSSSGAKVSARDRAGLFYGAQELAKLGGVRRVSAVDVKGTPSSRASIPCVTVRDWPDFLYRAMHLDVARHFFSKETVKRYIDLLAFYRFNVFHWHLTDDQAFRLEIAGHPELTAAGGESGVYTHDDVREIVAFAKDRFITVVPEIEMPGHARAILASHPELSCTGKKQPPASTWGVFEDVLCAGNDKTFALLEDILADAVKVFPSKAIHIGGDEVPSTRWTACKKCQRAMREANTDSRGLEAIFLKKASAILGRLGRRSIVWDEPELAGQLPQGQAVVAWRSQERGAEAVRALGNVVMAPQDRAYFNFWQSKSRTEPGHEGYLPWTKVLSFHPIPTGLEPVHHARILGGEGALWTEYVTTEEHVDTLVMPRMAALAEALWRAGPRTEPADFATRFRLQRPLLDASGVHYFVEPPAGLPSKKVILAGGEARVTLSPPQLFTDGVIRVTTDDTEPTASSPPFAPFAVRQTTHVATALFLPGGRKSPTVRGVFEVQEPRAARPVQRLQQGVKYKYYEGDFHRLPDLAKRTPKSTGRTTSIALLPAFRPERFAVVYEGLVRVPTTGVVRFIARADDGVRVEVDGEKVLEDDGEHEPRESDGEIALAAGHHAIRVTYFQGAEGKVLSVEAEGPGLPRGPLAVVSAAP